ncbi:MAG TPA: DUF6519 domain-containing protein [Candidatus Limnocylindria bacterium]|nr:DUF6519 domain-containing protein [Candidatus Limnocylindria bacterium]
MSFDLSRIRFDPRRDFLGVVMQQGRVQLDADWNEWVAELARRIQAGTLDTFNGNVVPRITPDGFLIEAVGGALTIGPGRMYVDGILAENHGGAPDEWDQRLAELTGTAAIDYTAQPYYPDPPPLPEAGTQLVYLDVWQRDITPVIDPGLIEQAVGVDTTGRLQTVWQVKFFGVGSGTTCGTPDEDIDLWQAEIAPSAGRLSTDTGDPVDEPSPCEVPPAAGYRGLENQLYRVEVHTGGPVGTATFKWSRDNGTVASRVTHINPSRDRITVESLGRDDVLSFHDGEWVEVTDDWRELHGLAGDLRRIAPAGGVDRTARTLTFEAALTAGLFPVDGQQATDPGRNTRVRRWDQGGVIHAEDGSEHDNLDTSGVGEILIPPAGTRLFLEHGILVEFDLAEDGGAFHVGDYWCFAARTADASIEILDDAPPLGIHHHYARLAVVTFPDEETDCRTLWPPIAEGEGCDCSVCVTAEGHNSGQATIQQAVDSVKDVGGTVCLGIGTYELRDAISVDDARSFRIRGQGWGTILVRREGGTAIEVTGGLGVALERFSILVGGGNQGLTPGITARGIVDFDCSQLNVLAIAAGDGIGVALALSGLMLRCRVSDCALVAHRGIAFVPPDGDGGYLLTAELGITRNVMICRRSGVRFTNLSLHYGNSRIEENLILAGTEGGVVATGGVFPGSSFAISGNVIATQSTGIRGGVDNLTVEANEISGMQETSGDAIVLEEGVDAVALDRVRIAANRIASVQGNAVVINQRVETAIVCDNFIDGIGLGALVMGEAGAAGMLQFRGNVCTHLGTFTANSQTAYAAVQLIRVENADVTGNVIAEVARDAVASGAVSAIRCAGVTRVRVADNRLYDIGPARGGQVTGVRIVPPFDHAAMDGNTILRLSAGNVQADVVAWSAINVSPESIILIRHFAAASFVPVDTGAFVLTATRLVVVPFREATLTISGNQLEGTASSSPVARVGSMHHCLFTDNTCQAHGRVTQEPTIGLISSRTITVTDNRLRSLGDMQTMHLQPQVERAIVMGNTSTGPIALLGAAPVPPDIGLTNIFSV